MAVAILLAIGLAGMSVAAHAASYGGPAFAVVDWLHMLAAAAWLGALPALLVLARRGRVAGGPGARPLARRAAPAPWRARHRGCPAGGADGIANSPLVLGTPRDVVGSDYGNLLLAKATLLAVALGIGAVNHLVPARSRPGGDRDHGHSGDGGGRPSGRRGRHHGDDPAIVGPAAGAHRAAGQPGPPVRRGSALPTCTPPSPRRPRPAGDPGVDQQATAGLPRTDVDTVPSSHPPATSDVEPVRVELDEAETVPGLFGASGAFTSEVGDWGWSS